MKVHDLRDSWMDAGDVYDYTQYSEDVEDGDVLVTGKAVVIMVEAWPTLVKGDAKNVFHRLQHGVSWETLDEGKYAESYKAAMAIEL